MLFLCAECTVSVGDWPEISSWTVREVSGKLRLPPNANLMADGPTYSELLH